MIVIGLRHLGRTDEVSGLFHVETLFFHFNFIPLVPLESFLILDARRSSAVGQPQRRGGRLALPIPLSGKSIIVAWIRFVASVFLVGSTVWFMITCMVDTDPDQLCDNGFPCSQCLRSLGVILVTVPLSCFLLCGALTRMASYERAIDICSQLEPRAKAHLRDLVDRHFQQAGAFVALGTVESCEGDDQFEDEWTENNKNDHDPTIVTREASTVVPSDIELAETSTPRVSAPSPSPFPITIPGSNKNSFERPDESEA